MFCGVKGKPKGKPKPLAFLWWGGRKIRVCLFLGYPFLCGVQVKPTGKPLRHLGRSSKNNELKPKPLRVCVCVCVCCCFFLGGGVKANPKKTPFLVWVFWCGWVPQQKLRHPSCEPPDLHVVRPASRLQAGEALARGRAPVASVSRLNWGIQPPHPSGSTNPRSRM